MAIAKYLHGSTATIDVTFDAISMKCAFGRWFAQFVRQATGRTTFCSGGWVEEQPGMIQLIGQLDGFSTVGTETYHNPLQFITKTTPVAIVLTADTAVTLTFNGNVFSDSMEMIAAANAGRSIGFRSTGSVASAGFVTV